MCGRDFAAAEEIVSKTRNQEIAFAGTFVPPRVITLWLEFLKGNHPTVEEFGAAREELYPKIKAQPANAGLYTALAFADVALGLNEEAVKIARGAIEMRPISENALAGPLCSG